MSTYTCTYRTCTIVMAFNSHTDNNNNVLGTDTGHVCVYAAQRDLVPILDYRSTGFTERL